MAWLFKSIDDILLAILKGEVQVNIFWWVDDAEDINKDLYKSTAKVLLANSRREFSVILGWQVVDAKEDVK